MGWQSMTMRIGFSLAAGWLLALAGGCSAESADSHTVGPSGVVSGPGVTGTGGNASNPGSIAGVGGGAGSDQTPVGHPSDPIVQSGATIPCAVAQVVKTSCQGCHGAQLIGGAPMALMTHADFAKADYVVKYTDNMIGQTVKVADLARIRLNATSKPMPQGAAMAGDKKAILNDWLVAGAPAGTEADRTCLPPDDGTVVDNPDMVYDFKPLEALPGETCYEFPTHGGQNFPDTSDFMVPAGENYEQFYYKVPWNAGDVGARYGTRFDNKAVLHHWLMFTTGLPKTDGQHSKEIGSQSLLGDTNSRLIAGWAVGGSNVTPPEDVGFVLPDGGMLNIQWHLYNQTGAPAPDHSAPQVCVVPKGARAHVAGMTWLGTEFIGAGPLGMPPGKNDAVGTCPNDSGADITIVAFWPHMHKFGRNMKSVVTDASGGNPRVVFDKPFDFNSQLYYDVKPRLVVKAGEKITSTCGFDVAAPGGIPFGPSSDQEMCYQFAFAYPAFALDNGVPSLIGAMNTCW
jgi:hypothetical protein